VQPVSCEDCPHGIRRCKYVRASLQFVLQSDHRHHRGASALPPARWWLSGSGFWILGSGFRFLGLPPVAVCGVASVEKEMKYLSGLKVIILLKSGGNQRIHILKSTCGISEVCRSPPRQFKIGGVSLSHFPRSGDRGVAEDVASVASLFRSRPFSKTENWKLTNCACLSAQI